MSFNRKEVKGVDNLKNLSLEELEILLKRQNAMVSNVNSLKKLPDKGDKIIKYRDELLKELDHRKRIDEATQSLSNLNIASDSKKIVNDLEWTGNDVDHVSTACELDSDDEDNPLKILAQSAGGRIGEKKIIQTSPVETLITPDDIKEAASISGSDINENINNSVKLTSKARIFSESTKEKLKKSSQLNKKATEANSSIKLLNMEESLQLQKESEVRLQKIKAKHAIERLNEIYSRQSDPTSYREPDNYGSHDEEENEDQEYHEAEDGDEDN